MPINNIRPYASDPRLQKGRRPTGSGRWINSGNGIADGFAGINFQPVPTIAFPTMPQQMTQRERGTSPNEKSEESSADRGVSSTSEYPAVFQESTRAQQKEENLREESPTSEPIKLDRESVPPACRENCEGARDDSISVLIEEALRNGELLRSDEWIRWRNATMKHGAHKGEQREEENTRKKSTIGSSCRGNCVDDPGSDSPKVFDETLGNGESSRHDEWIGKQNATRRREKEVKKPSRWDDVVQGSRGPRPAPGSVPVCSNSTFCTHATHYPEELVNRAIQGNDSLRLLQSVDPVSEVGDRLEFDELNDSPFCSSHVRLIYPRSTETMDQRWLYVVNQDNLRQGVRIEMCAKKGSVCGDLDDYLPGGYKAVCKQKYVYRELVAVNGGIVKKDSFRFPSSCCCHREFVG